MKNQSRRTGTDRIASRPAEVPNAPIRSRSLNLKRIVVPLDFSGKSRQALEFAIPLAEQHGARIVLVHVVHLPPALAAPVTGSEVSFVAVDARPHVERAQAHLQELANKLLPPGLVEKLVVRVGVPYHEIVEAADELQAGLLVITTHGHTGLKHVFLGSTAEWVVRHAPCPVLTVRRHD